jgi:choline monooxygenase
VHAESFGEFPEEESCEHVLEEKYTTFRTPTGGDWLSEAGFWAVRRLGSVPECYYTHHHVHPNLLISSMDMYHLAISIQPTSPTTCRQMCWLYSRRGNKRGVGARMLSRLLAWGVTKYAKQILREDMSIFAAVQRGMQNSVHRGVIGTREERLYVFQKFVTDRCSDAAQLNASEPSDFHSAPSEPTDACCLPKKAR